MMTSVHPYLVPANDGARLAALQHYRLLDARREKILDDVVATTARLFHVSNAMLSIVEESEVLVKSPYNLPVDIERIPREQSLCSATILHTETAVFEDLGRKSAPGIDISLILQLGMRFYAGHNLRTPEGYNIGTLCLFDGAPRYFPRAERQLLGQLAGLVMHLLELRRVLGPHSGITSMLWGTIYQAMSEQLSRLTELAKRTPSTVGLVPLTPSVIREAGAIVTILDNFVANTLRRL